MSNNGTRGRHTKEGGDMQVICLEDQAFNAILDQLFDRFKKELAKKEDKWISPEEAMQKLRITSKTTLQKLRDEGKIRYSQPAKKIILYDLDSIYNYLNENAREIFKTNPIKRY